MAVEISKDQIKCALLGAVNNTLSTLPFSHQLEYDGVIGVHLDETTEFFISLHQRLNKVVADNTISSTLCDASAEGFISSQGNAKNLEAIKESPKQHALLIPSQGHRPVRENIVNPCKDAQYLLEALKNHEAQGEQISLEMSENTLKNFPGNSSHENVEVFNEQTLSSPTTENQSNEQELTTIVIEVSQDVSQSEIPDGNSTNITETIDITHADMEESEDQYITETQPLSASTRDEYLKSSSSVPQSPKFRSKRNITKLYKVPRGHLDNAPCECCQVLQRYREKDKNVRRRRQILEETGKLPPKLPPSKVYKLPTDHVNLCSCCEVLGKRREYWKELTRRRRSGTKESAEGLRWIEVKQSTGASHS